MEIKKRPVVIKMDNKIILNDIEGVLSDFKSVLEDKVNLDIFYYKQQTLKFISASSEGLSKDFFLAEYDVLSNSIFYNKEFFKDAVMHELLHMASCLKNEGTIFLGLSQIDIEGNKIIGVGINEAYTALLDDKYFKDYTETKSINLFNSYKILKSLFSYIPLIFGDEVIEDMYFTADLDGFINVLSEYMEKNSILYFIMAMDNLYYVLMETMSVGKSSIKNIKILFHNYRYVLGFIGQLYLTYIADLYYLGEISEDTYKELLNSVKKIISQPLSLSDFPFIKSKSFKDREIKYLMEKANEKILKKYT